MTAQITHLPANTTQEVLLQCMAEDGAVIIDGVLGSEELQALDNDLAPFLKKEVYGRDAFTGFHTQRIGALIARSKACGELALEPRMLDSARTYLAEHCDDVQLHFTSAVARLRQASQHRYSIETAGSGAATCPGKSNRYLAPSGR